jgi:ubiquinone/menaquinone biosynthesis C-methylase UbiE
VPAPSGSVDVVTISLVLHHLLPPDKRAALSEAKRILKPGGHLHVADWGAPSDPLMSGLFLISQAIDGFDRTADHRAGHLPGLIAETGFGPVERYANLRTAGGNLDLLTAAR